MPASDEHNKNRVQIQFSTGTLNNQIIYCQKHAPLEIAKSSNINMHVDNGMTELLMKSQPRVLCFQISTLFSQIPNFYAPSLPLPPQNHPLPQRSDLPNLTLPM